MNICQRHCEELLFAIRRRSNLVFSRSIAGHIGGIPPIVKLKAEKSEIASSQICQARVPRNDSVIWPSLPSWVL